MHHPTRRETARLTREKQTIRVMVEYYCRAHHTTPSSLCPECQALYDYAVCRLDRCPFGARKTTCARCPIHCFKPAMREQITTVMRYTGPRMMFRHPILALLHQLDTLRNRKAKKTT